MSRLPSHFAASSLVVAIALSCGFGCRHREPILRDASSFMPINVEGCPAAPADGLLPEQRTMLALVSALHAEKHTIYGVNTDQYKVYTNFSNRRGVVVAFEAQVYSNGAAMIFLPETMLPQTDRHRQAVAKFATRLVRVYLHHRCQDAQALRQRAAQAGVQLF